MVKTFGKRTSFHATVEDNKNMTVVKYWEGNEELFTNYVFNDEDTETRKGIAEQISKFNDGNASAYNSHSLENQDPSDEMFSSLAKLEVSLF